MGKERVEERVDRKVEADIAHRRRGDAERVLAIMRGFLGPPVLSDRRVLKVARHDFSSLRFR